MAISIACGKPCDSSMLLVRQICCMMDIVFMNVGVLRKDNVVVNVVVDIVLLLDNVLIN